ncbi:hypothetical protein Ocin01_20161 [Orchesella cincta]|uniref:Fructose-2,6-bisphosphatase TIGAR n=1 Tax=Orchesella cincta TaxID=48709 RepID=A0A1D2M0N2_ORCCI|nr:hypothetical protein Ocin01_20161 [Orchesella cincta]
MRLTENVTLTLYLVRHGECKGNVEDAAIEPFSNSLTDVGRTQSNRKPPRSKIVKPDMRIRERDYTGFIGKTAADCIEVMMGMVRTGSKYLECQIPNSENTTQFEDRLISFLSEIIKECKTSQNSEENVLAVSHQFAIQRLMILLNNRAQDFGIGKWTHNLFSEKLMRNTTFHKIVFEIPRNGSEVTAHVAYPISENTSKEM